MIPLSLILNAVIGIAMSTAIAETESLSTRTVDRAALAFNLVAVPGRLRIIRMLAAGSRNVKQIAEALGMTQPAISHHLHLLRLGRAIEYTRRGKENHYDLTPLGRRLAAAAHDLAQDD